MFPLIIGEAELWQGECLDVLKAHPANSLDACVTDPPYGLEFMGVGWDTLRTNGKARIATDFDVLHSKEHPRKAAEQAGIRHKKNISAYTWHHAWALEVLRVLKPGAHCVAFGGTRTHHRLMCALEDAGFEIRDTLMWVYGSGFPKSLNVSKALDRAAGAEREIVGYGTNGMGRMNQNNAKAGYRPNPYSDGVDGVPITAPTTDDAKQWDGYGTALKPAWEPIILCRKPLEGTVIENVLKWGTGALNIDACRVGEVTDTRRSKGSTVSAFPHNDDAWQPHVAEAGHVGKRWPANVVHDGSAEVLEAFPQANSTRANGNPNNPIHADIPEQLMSWGGIRETHDFRDTGSAARFFYAAKASRSERGEGNVHPCVKPVSLMRWLIRLVVPSGGVLLDPFAGSGTTGVAAHAEGRGCLLIEREPEYHAIAARRITEASGQTVLFSQEGRRQGG